MFVIPAVAQDLKERVGGLAPRARALLIDALDPVLHLDEYRIFACPAEFEPRLPSWPEERAGPARGLRPLDPPPERPGRSGHPRSVQRGRRPRRRPRRWAASPYRTSTGALGELDRRSDLVLRTADGRRTCGEIDRILAETTGVADPIEIRQDRWIGLADSGLVLLESRDPREHVDCRHLGRVLDRLDCTCPRRWVRACDGHDHCTLIDGWPERPCARGSGGGPGTSRPGTACRPARVSRL